MPNNRKRYLDEVYSRHIPTIQLPEVQVSSTKLPLEYNDNNINKYAEAVANNQININQIPNQQLRNAVRAKPIVDKIREDTDREGMRVGLPLLGLAAAPMLSSAGGGAVPAAIKGVLNNPIFNAIQTVESLKATPRTVRKGISQIKEGKYLRGIGNMITIPLDIYGGIATYKNTVNTGKRAIESIMRQSSVASRSKREIVQGIKDNLSYILFKGKPNFGPYGGYYDYSEAYNIPRENDLISAFLYGNRLDPRLGKYLGSSEDLYGFHKGYIRKKYPKKIGKIPVYEAGKPEDYVSPYLVDAIAKGKAIGFEGDIPARIGEPLYINAAGHHVVPISKNAVIQQDIWKFNPEEYLKRWLSSNPATTNYSIPRTKLSKKLVKMGLRFLDRHSTPVITRSKPVVFTDNDLINIQKHYK